MAAREFVGWTIVGLVVLALVAVGCADLVGQVPAPNPLVDPEALRPILRQAAQKSDETLGFTQLLSVIQYRDLLIFEVLDTQAVYWLIVYRWEGKNWEFVEVYLEADYREKGKEATR